MKQFIRKFSSPAGGRFLASARVIMFGFAIVGLLVGNGGFSLVSVVHSDQVDVGSSASSSASSSVSDGGSSAYSSASSNVSVHVNIGNSSSSASSSVASADLSVTKTVDNATPKQGDPVNYTVTVSALGPATSTGVVANDLLSSGITFVSVSSSIGTYSSSTGAWTIGDISAHSIATLTIAVIVNASSGTTIANTATVGETASSTDSNTGNNTASVTITVAANGCTGNCGGPSYRALAIIVGGLQNGATSSVAVADITTGTTTTTVAGNGTLPVALPLNDQYVVTATTTAPDYTMATSTGCAGTLATNAVCNVTFSLVSPTSSADLSVTKTVDNATPNQGDSVNYTVTVSALGPATSTGVVATDTLPTGLAFENATATKGSYASTTGTWTIGDMSASSTAILTIAALVNASSGTPIANTATVGETASSTDSNTGNNSSSVSLIVGPLANLGVTKVIDNPSPYPGDTVHYTIVISDPGPASSTNVVATDTLPLFLTFVNATTSQGSYASSTGTWLVGNMAVGSTATIIITAIVNASSGVTIVNTVNVDGTPDPSASASLTVISSSTADLSATKTVDNTAPYQGNTVNYTVTVSALGPATSTGVVANDLLPSGLTFVSAIPSVGSYASSTGTWTIGDMSAHSTATLSISAIVNAPAGTAITNTATAGESASSTDQNASNNTAVISLTVAAPACTSNCGGGGGGGGGGGIAISGGGGGSAYELAINGGAAETATTSVVLSLYGTGAYMMEISNTPGFASSTWIPYATVLPWVLTPGAGTKTVYAQYRSVSGDIVGAVHASINLVQGQGGQVLGASTSCGIYLRTYIKKGAQNDTNEVMKLQIFLNENLGKNLPVTGYYDSSTYEAVNQFQVKYGIPVLLPWVPYGLANATTPTGYVYKTTKRWINELMCSELNLPMPQLP